MESARDTSPVTPSASPKKRRSVNRKLGSLPEHLPRIEEVVEPESLDCPRACGAMHKIGEDGDPH